MNRGHIRGKSKIIKTPLTDAVSQFHHEDRVSFHVPGHKSRDFSDDFSDVFGSGVLQSDLTELPGLDDLHHPSGVIEEAERYAAEVFGAEETFFLINGTSGGITAAIAAVVSEENTLILERHSHECATRGLVLSGAVPYYIDNYYDEETGLFTGISPSDAEYAISHCFSPAAILLTHPSYYGTYSELRRIVDIAHRAGMIVIVDEAHGSQLTFAKQEGIPSALSAGADLVVQSTHKMLGSLTQSSMIHVQGSRVDRDRLRYYLSFMNSTSPSYLLMSSLDLTRAFLEDRGEELWGQLLSSVNNTRDRLNQLGRVFCPLFFTDYYGQKHRIESSRLLISLWEHGLTGTELGHILAEHYGIDVEFSGIRYTVALAGTGSAAGDFDRLVSAIEDIVASPGQAVNPLAEKQLVRYGEVHRIRPKTGMTPRQAVCARTVRLNGTNAEGMVSARDVSLYPPGIPVIRTGEVFSYEIINYIEKSIQSGLEFHGTGGIGEDGKIRFFCAEDPMTLDLINGFF